MISTKLIKFTYGMEYFKDDLRKSTNEDLRFYRGDEEVRKRALYFERRWFTIDTLF